MWQQQQQQQQEQLRHRGRRRNSDTGFGSQPAAAVVEQICPNVYKQQLQHPACKTVYAPYTGS
jgi:hypothetical protein